MDSTGGIRFVTTDGRTGNATKIPVGTSTRRSTFAVSPDNRRIAVVVGDYSSSGVSLRLYVEDVIGGGHHIDLYKQAGSFGLWPIGWHGGMLVLAQVPACRPGQAVECCGTYMGPGPALAQPLELHVVDATTAARRFTIGGAGCTIAGPSTRAGTPCLTSSKTVRILDWAGVPLRTVSVTGDGPFYLSPNGAHLAYQPYDEATTWVEGFNPLAMASCGWVDDTHIMSPGKDVGGLWDGKVGDITTGTMYDPKSLLGTCAGNVPGGL